MLTIALGILLAIALLYVAWGLITWFYLPPLFKKEQADEVYPSWSAWWLLLIPAIGFALAYFNIY